MRIDYKKAKELNLIPLRVFVDGVEVKDCVSFDVEYGRADYDRIDSNGYAITCGENNDEIEKGHIFGKVTYSKLEFDEH